MAKEEITPSEWQIMEVLWAWGKPLTSSEVYKRMKENVDMSMRMVRVLMNRLNQKDVLGYTVDEHDSRVYHYYVQKTREECVKEKSRKFVDSYFSGNETNAMAALLQSFTLTDEQIKELEGILEKSKDCGAEYPHKEGGNHA
ncbi:BlaI/MecI/CopY family transcriptional regulator [bacterium 1XD42-8]|jgi:BlaI family penicillinase repressor|nr:BlaI/MecI/CopY family transcriptional regulator [Lachnospiraceae bacterium]RKJ32978.1 BlaI/MecI/CopY family transcriptional regulator [bacterium 1XD42-8]